MSAADFQSKGGVTLSLSGGVARVTIRRGDRFNALGMETLKGLRDAARALRSETAAHAVIVHGDPVFTAGADLKERPALEEAGACPRHNRIVRESFNAVMECEKPVIAAINGAAIGAGCVLALCCDILIASEGAYLAMTEVDVGLAGGVSHVRRFFRPPFHWCPWC